MDKITRREKLLAKVCWPEIDTQRTRFYSTDTAGAIVFPVFSHSPLVYRNDSTPVDRLVQIDTETVSIDKWAYRGKRHNVVAHWGYSPLIDTVVIRDVRIEYHTAQAVVPVLRRMFSDTP
jgi:hypothetical protein